MSQIGYLETSIYKMGPTQCKVVYLKRIANDEEKWHDKKHNAKNTVNEDKLMNNVIRSKSLIKELGLCNHWDYFATITLDPDKYDRSELKPFIRAFSKFVRDNLHGSIKYLMVPELHKDEENWHFHCLFAGDLLLKDLDYCPIESVAHKNMHKGWFYSPLLWTKFGINTIEPVKNHDAVVYYTSKYLTKALSSKGKISLGSHLYMCSKGLTRKERIDSGIAVNMHRLAKENDFCGVAYVRPEIADRIGRDLR